MQDAFGLKQEAHLRWTRDHSPVNWQEFICCEVRANETYTEEKRQFSDRNRDVLMNVQAPHKWWSTLKSAVFGSSSSLPPLISKGRGLCSALWVLEVLSCLYRHSFYQTDHSKLWWMVVEVNWLTLYQECCRAVFWARYCSSCTLRSCFPFCKIS